MDIKDVNNAGNLLLFNKSTAQNSSLAALGAGFASLIGQNSGNVAADLIPSSDNAQVPAKDDRPVYRNGDKNRPDNKKEAKTSAEINRPNNKKTVKTEKKTVEKNDVLNAPDGNEGTALAQISASQNQDVEASAEEGISEIDAVAGDKKAAAPAVVDGEPAVKFSDNLKVSGADGIKLEDSEIKLSDLAKMDSVTIYNPESGKTMTVSGAELAQRLAADTGVMNGPAEADSVQNGINQAAAVVTMPEVVDEAVESIEENGAFVAAGKEQHKAENADKAAGVEYKNGVSDELQAQNAELAGKLDGKEKIKVEVSVKEEKISYLNGKELVRDRLALDKAIAAAADGEASDNPAVTPQAGAVNGSQPQTANYTAAGYAPVVNAAVAAQLDNGVEASAVSGASEIGSVTTASTAAAGLTGAEMVGNVKAEGNAKTTDASLRDIYKGMSKEAVEQVKVNITKSAVKGVDTIDVRLKPEDLGHIEIKMQIKDGKLQAHIISSRPETMDALQKEAQTLEKAFNDAGFQTDESSLSFSFRDDGQAGQNQNRESGLRNFIGEVFENEANGELLADAANYEWNGGQGLNIRV